jgi:P4 family phage/plasmid primase-like protien
MKMWSEISQFAEIYLNDPADFYIQGKERADKEGVSWRTFEAEVKKAAKKIDKARSKAESQTKRDEAKAERDARQQAAAHHGAPHMQLGSHAEVSKALLRYLTAKHGEGPAYDEGHFWVYSKQTGAWQILTDGYMAGTIQSWDGIATVGAESKPWACANSETPVKMAINDLELIERGAGFFKDRYVGIAFADGFVGIENNAVKLLPNSPGNRCRFALPMSISDAKMEGSRFEQMQIEQFGSLQDTRCLLLWEWVGMCLIGKITDANKCLILWGPGGSGKGTLLRIIQACFPVSAVTTIQPQKWTHGPSLDNLAKARLNAVNEMNTDDLSDVGRFKAVISGDNLDAEAKYKAPYTFAPRAGHIFTVNPGQLPTVPEADGPFWDRFLCVPVERVFRDTDEQDRGIADYIIRNEIHIVVAFALKCAVASLKRGRFSQCEAGEAIISEWKDGVNPVAQFLAERTIPFEGTAVHLAPSLAEVFETYQKWCLEAGHKPSSRTTFGRRLRALGLMKTSNGNRVMVKILQRHEYSDDRSPI